MPDYSGPASKAALWSYVAQHIAASPDRLALRDGNESLTYRELDERTRTIAQSISAQRGSSLGPVALWSDNSLDAVVRVLGILRSGAPYMPISRHWPNSKIARVQETSRCSVFLSADDSGALSPCHGGESAPAPESSPEARSSHPYAGDASQTAALHLPNLAYILWTSGSTGEPKGVQISHTNALTFLSGFERVAPAPTDLRGTMFTPLTFDVSVWEIFSVLGNGGTLYILPQAERHDPRALISYLSLHKISSAYLPPGILGEFASELETVRPSLSLARLLVGVEPITFNVLWRIQSCIPHLRILNGYGPTETTVCATLYPVPADNSSFDRVPIGRAIPGYQVALIKDDEEQAAIGEEGEIVISGSGVFQGYLDGQGPKAPSAECYRTGDYGRLLLGGDIEFRGRRDAQVKIRGYRVELGEIEHAAIRATGATQAKAIVEERASSSVLFVYLEGTQGISEAEAIKRISTRVAAYAVPNRVILVDSFPTTAHGKINVTSLRRSVESTPQEPTSPGDCRAQVLARCMDVFGIDQDSLRHSMFGVGASSLLAMQLVGRVRRELHKQVSYTDLAEAQSLQQFADLVAGIPREQNSGIQVSLRSILQSAAHRDILVLDRFMDEQAGLHTTVLIEANGRLDPDILTKGLRQVLASQPALRSRYALTARGVEVRLSDDVTPVIEVCDKPETAEGLEAWLSDRARTPFPVDSHLARFLMHWDSSRNITILTCVMHHLVFDGGSIDIFVKSLAKALAGDCLDQASDLDASVGFQAATPHPAGLYWKGKILESAQLMRLRTTTGIRTLTPAEPVKHLIRFSTEESALIRSTCVRLQVTPFSVVLAAAGQLLNQWDCTRGGDTLGVVVSRRESLGLPNTIGYLALVLPVTIGTVDAPLAECARRIAHDIHEGALHAGPGLTEMLPETARQGIRAGKSVLPIVVTEDFTPESSFVLAGMEARVISIDNPVSVFDLAIFVDVTAAQMAIRVEADARSIDVSSLSDLMTRLRSCVLKGLDLWGTTTADAVDSHFSNDLRAEAHLEASRASIGQYIEVSSVNATEQARTILATLGASDIEARISAVWGRTLGVPTVPTDVSFFSLGGTSLSLLIMRKELEIDLQKNIPVSVLFECPTVQQLARYIAEFESTSHLGKEVSAGLLRAARIRERRSNIGQKI